VRNWNVLTDLDFEALACDLFSAKDSRPVERFARGADGGIDLRWKTTAGGTGIGQCKHYARSTFSQLLATARDEIPKVRLLNPAEYRFITTFDLTVTQKEQIYTLFARWMDGPEDVYGGRDVDGLVTNHPDVEQRHLKLWLSTGSQLFWSTHSDIANRSDALRDRLERTLPNYVASSAFDAASRILEDHKVCLIAGEPGIGKTVLGRMLIAAALTRGFMPLEISGDINEAWAALDSDRLQVFFYDDFLGQISFSEKMGKNEDRRLADFVNKISSMKSKRLVMTTREYILRDARKDYRLLRGLDNKLHFVLELKDYSRANKALILYNHLWQAAVAPDCLKEMSNRGWIRIVDHQNYSPRLIEYCTGQGFDTETSGYLERFVDTLNHPEEIWSNAYDRHLTEEQRALLVVLASLPIEVASDDLHTAWTAFCATRGVTTTSRSFRTALEITEGTFIGLSKRSNETTVSFHSPSVAEFVLDQLVDDPNLLLSLVTSAIFFEQLRNLQAARSGSILGSRTHVENLHSLPLEFLRSEFANGYARTFISPSPDRLKNQGRFVSGYEQPHGYLEDRYMFLCDQQKDWRPDNSWMKSNLLILAERWSNDKGEKGTALKLIQRLDPELVTMGAYQTAQDSLGS
jgi:hypothetical protein